MNKLLLSLIIGIFLFSCTSEKKGSMLVKGEIKNIKKGTLYLQKVIDTVLVTVDSVSLDGINTFALSDAIKSPEMYYLVLAKSPDKQISFFGEKGTTIINTKLEKFVYGATIKGLSNQKLLEEYNEMAKKFSDKRLDLIKANFEANRSQDSIKLDSIKRQINSLVKNRYRYTTNFAVIHADKEVSPYLALTELFDANIKLLDTIQKSMTPEVKASIYGKKFEKFVINIKKGE